MPKGIISSNVFPPKAFRSGNYIDRNLPVVQKVFRKEGVTADAFQIRIVVREFLWFRIAGFQYITSNNAAEIASYGMRVLEGEQPISNFTQDLFNIVAYMQDWGFPDPTGSGGTWLFSTHETGAIIQDLTAIRGAMFLAGSGGHFFLPTPNLTFIGTHTLQFGSGIFAWSAQLQAARVRVMIEGVTEDQV